MVVEMIDAWLIMISNGGGDERSWCLMDVIVSSDWWYCGNGCCWC